MPIYKTIGWKTVVTKHENRVTDNFRQVMESQTGVSRMLSIETESQTQTQKANSGKKPAAAGGSGRG